MARSRTGCRPHQGRLELAGRSGVRRVYLLTETAGEFFPRFGFRRIERSVAPAEVQQSVEFMCVCPETAETMLLELEGMDG